MLGEQTWLDEDTALKAAARKGWGFESLLLRHFSLDNRALIEAPDLQPYIYNDICAGIRLAIFV